LLRRKLLLQTLQALFPKLPMILHDDVYIVICIKCTLV
jgi:hypothetical protein